MSVTQQELAVQYTFDQDGKFTSVTVPASLWKRIIEQLEDDEDFRLIVTMADDLKKHPSEWGIRWQDVRDLWE